MSETTGAGSKRIAILGGTGALGTGLVRRWTQAGHAVIIGSRTLEKAEAALAELKQVMAEWGATKLDVAAMENLDAARAADIVVLTVPFAHQKSTLEHVRPALDGKILVDVTVPLMPPKVGTVQLPPEGSAGMAAQQLLGETVKVVSAFQNVAAHHLHPEMILKLGNAHDMNRSPPARDNRLPMNRPHPPAPLPSKTGEGGRRPGEGSHPAVHGPNARVVARGCYPQLRLP